MRSILVSLLATAVLFVGTVADQQQRPGSIDFDQNLFNATLVEPANWHLRGTVSRIMSRDKYHAGSLTYNFNQPEDYNGHYIGALGRGNFVMRWPSGATIVGYVPIPDMGFDGDSYVVYDP